MKRLQASLLATAGCGLRLTSEQLAQMARPTKRPPGKSRPIEADPEFLAKRDSLLKKATQQRVEKNKVEHAMTENAAGGT